MTHRDSQNKFLSRKISTATAEDLKNEAFRYNCLSLQNYRGPIVITCLLLKIFPKDAKLLRAALKLES